MAQPQVSLFIDVQNRTLVRSFTSTIPALLPVAYQGDTLNLTLRFLQATGVPSAPYTDIDYSSAAVTVAVGANEAKPTAGLFTVTDTAASQTTATLPYNVTAFQMQTAIQSALTTHWSKATVYGGTGGPFTITNGSNGVQTALIGTALTLEPASSIAITILQMGDTDLPAIQYLQLNVNPIALQDTWSASHSPELLTGTLAIDTASIEAVMGNSPNICTVFSIRVVPMSGSPFTVVQNVFLIQNDLILGAPGIPTPGVSYYTTIQSDARYRGTGTYIERDSTGDANLTITTADAGPNNILFLLSNNTAGAATITLQDGTFDGQTITLRIDSDSLVPDYPGSITLTFNLTITTNGNPPAFGGFISLGNDAMIISFMWDAANSVWISML